MKKDIKIIYKFFKNLLKAINKLNYGYPILYIENGNFATIKYVVNYSNINESEQQSYRNINHCIYRIIKNIFSDNSFECIHNNYQVTTNGVFDYHILPNFKISTNVLVQRTIDTCTTYINFYGINGEYIEVIKSIFGKNLYYEDNIRKTS